MGLARAVTRAARPRFASESSHRSLGGWARWRRAWRGAALTRESRASSVPLASSMDPRPLPLGRRYPNCASKEQRRMIFLSSSLGTSLGSVRCGHGHGQYQQQGSLCDAEDTPALGQDAPLRRLEPARHRSTLLQQPKLKQLSGSMPTCTSSGTVSRGLRRQFAQELAGRPHGAAIR